jgi:uncharacterized membrane protein YedE/YeeE
MKVNLIGLAAGVAFGFILAWARLTDPLVIRDMLLLRDAHVFWIMGSAILVAAVGCRVLLVSGVRSLLTAEPIQWSVARPEPRHVLGSVLFGTGWSVAGTCPGPVAAMIGEGRLAGLIVAAGILVGVLVQVLVGPRAAARSSVGRAHAVGL